MVTALDFPTQQVRFEFRSLRFQIKTPDKLYAHLCLCHQTVKFGTGQEAIVSCNWEGNRRFGVTDFSGSSTYGLTTYGGEMSIPLTLLVGYGTL